MDKKGLRKRQHPEMAIQTVLTQKAISFIATSVAYFDQQISYPPVNGVSQGNYFLPKSYIYIYIYRWFLFR